jgi:hypothetical protein
MSPFRLRCALTALIAALLLISAPVQADLAIDDRYRAGNDYHLHTVSSTAQNTVALKPAATGTSGLKSRGGRYFVEFRGELAYFPGNTSFIYGTLGADGEPADYQHASFQPAYGVLGLIAGSIIPWKHYIGAYPWDTVVPPLIRYRTRLSAQQYRRLVEFVETTRRSDKLFYLYTDNCVRFARDAARAAGLRAPEETFVLPAVYVNMLRIANSGH